MILHADRYLSSRPAAAATTFVPAPRPVPANDATLIATAVEQNPELPLQFGGALFNLHTRHLPAPGGQRPHLAVVQD